MFKKDKMLCELSVIPTIRNVCYLWGKMKFSSCLNLFIIPEKSYSFIDVVVNIHD